MTTNPKLYWDSKDPSDVAPYSLNFIEWLIPKTSTTERDTITTASVTVVPSGLTATGALINITADTVTTIISSGTAGAVYSVSFLIHTLQNITIQRSVELQVLER